MGCVCSNRSSQSLLPVESIVKNKISNSLPKQEKKLILVGSSSAGKTQFFCSFKEESYDTKMENTNPNLRSSLCCTEFYKTRFNNIIILLWDSAGSSEFIGITKNFIQGKFY